MDILNYLDIPYLGTIVFGGELLTKLKLKWAKKYQVLVLATVTGVLFYFINQEPNYPVKLIMNYCWATSMYELIVKKIKEQLRAGETGLEPVRVGTKNRCLTAWLLPNENYNSIQTEFNPSKNISTIESTRALTCSWIRFWENISRRSRTYQISHFKP